MTNYQETELDEELVVLENDEDSEFLDPVMEPFNPSEIDIIAGQMSLDALIKRIRYDEIDMNTDFQRNAELWNNQKMSRLIESVLIRFPLPAFYFDATEDDNWLIVDGLQRLSSIRRFVIKKNLRLSGLEFLVDLNGKNFDQLHRQYQRRIEECQVTVYTIRPGTPSDVKYSVFRRINTSGLTLNNQEIRNAMAKPRDRELLEELSSLEYSKIMLGDLSKRMKDHELVLRFWAFYSFDYLEAKNKKEMASFLDRAMEEIKKGNDEYRNNFKSKYSIAIKRCYQLLGEFGFEKEPSSDSRKRSKNSTLFEVWMVQLARLSCLEFKDLLNKKADVQSRASNLLKDIEFFNSITYSTQKRDHVEMRYEKVKNLISGVLGD